MKKLVVDVADEQLIHYGESLLRRGTENKIDIWNKNTGSRTWHTEELTIIETYVKRKFYSN
eukprot:snap_masked-scaffold_46-processed-gene-1.50-mRNA-1 protein AED:1.00 eAED:1.00 QI:0/-1/0/0/-1/1/1/0/60